MKKLILLILLAGCLNQDGEKISVPPEIKDLPDVNIYATDQNPDTVILKKVNLYGDRPEEDLFFRSMGDFTVDAGGRVYITDAARGIKKIHVFSSGGQYITGFGGAGRGPREFLGPCCLKNQNRRLFVYDHRQFKMNVYSTDPLTYLKTYSINPANFPVSDKSRAFSPSYYFLSDSTYLAGLSESPARDNKEERKYADYYRMNRNWEINSDKLFRQLLVREVWGKYKGLEIWQRFPFIEKSLMAVSDQGYIYRAQSDTFLVKKYDANGEYIESFYYPYARAPVSREDALRSANKMALNIGEEMKLPEYWPVLNSMEFDDEDRLWITTITESTKKLKWWVLDHTGQLIATFMWPGKRAKQAYGLKEEVIIRNGYFYTKEKDKKTGARQIVKYDIQFKAQ